MTNDELERVMNFIIERQEVAAEQLAALAVQQAQMGNAQGDHDERIARFERSYNVIADLLQRHDTQIVALTDGLNNLTRIVERYITARGNGGNGGNQ